MANKKEMKKPHPNKGKHASVETEFKEGNTIGKDTRFKPGHTLSKKYDDSLADDLLAFYRECAEEGVFLPTVEKWAVERNISITSVFTWVKEYPQFEVAYRQAQAIQRNMLIQNGLIDKYNSSLVKFVLNAMHGLSEKNEVEQSQKNPFEVKINVVK